MTRVSTVEVTESFLRQWYDTEALRNPQSQIYRLPHAQKRMAVIKDLLADRIQGSAVLDVGCGQGLYSQWCLANGAGYVTGFDISPRNIQQARILTQGYKNCAFTVRSWDNAFDADDYDVVLATEVFEHALHPKELAERCMAGRVLIASAPISEPCVPDDPWKEQGHLHCFRNHTFVELFGKVHLWFNDGIYAYVVVVNDN